MISLKSSMKYLVKNFVFVLLIFLIISGVFTIFSQPLTEKKEVSLTQLVEDINQAKVKSIVVSGNDLAITYQDDSTAKSKKESSTITAARNIATAQMRRLVSSGKANLDGFFSLASLSLFLFLTSFLFFLLAMFNLFYHTLIIF